jgi:lysophospholipid acyltransferase (LPLAT)-like uncharacterized protein
MTFLVYGGEGLKILISRHCDGKLISRIVRVLAWGRFGVQARGGGDYRDQMISA